MKSFTRIIGAVAVMGLILTAPALGQSLQELPFAKKVKLAKVGDEDAQLAVAEAYEAGADGEAPDPPTHRTYTQRSGPRNPLGI
jgi:hypothetical protein